jgi:hypothetical protein
LDLLSVAVNKTDMDEISNNLEKIKKRIQDAALACGRRLEDIKLIAVSKTKPAEMVGEAHGAGQKIFGENYVQELRQKSQEFAGTDIEWHFIGHLQRNKVKYVVPIVKCIHSINSIKLAEEIEKRAESKIDSLIEINLAGEESKSGIAPGGLEELIAAIGKMEHVNLIGLMTMPPYDEDPEKSRPYFKRLRQIEDDINDRKLYPKRLTELSMGMTGDLEVAIEEGSTMVRVGTAIFGERDYGGVQ